MNILTTISYYSPHISGLTICVQRLIDNLSKKNLTFHVLTSQHNASLPREERHYHIAISRLPVIGTIGKVPVMPVFPFVAWNLVSQADLVWIHVPQAEGLFVAMLAKMLGKRIVSTVHCLPLLPSGWQRTFGQWFFDGINNLILRLSDHVVYYTHDYAEHTHGLFHEPKKSSYIYPVVFSNKYSPWVPHGNLRGSSSREFRIGFVGRMAEDKGLEVLLSALDLISKKRYPVCLDIVGPTSVVGEKNYRDRLHTLIAAHADSVTFRGELTDSELTNFYRTIQCLVLPSVNRTEAFGVVQIEAMSQGTPVVVSDLPGVRIPALRTGFGAVVPPHDAKKLADAILSVVQKKWQREQMVKMVYREFPPEVSLRAYETLLHRMLSS